MSTGNSNIVDRVVERIQKQPLGDLITEEDLYDIVKSAIPKVFFERQETKNSYGNITGTKEPLIIEIMQTVLKEQAAVIVNQWIVENADVVKDYWTQVTDKGLIAYVQMVQDKQATSHVSSMLQNWITAINQERYKQGLSNL
jgi:hypothetical protein